MLQPLDDRILVRKIEISDEPINGIYMPETTDTTSMEGVVLAVGPGKRNKDGTREPLVIKTGDRILFAGWAAKNIEVEGEELALLIEENIIGLLHLTK